MERHRGSPGASASQMGPGDSVIAEESRETGVQELPRSPVASCHHMLSLCKLGEEHRKKLPDASGNAPGFLRSAERWKAPLQREKET